MTENKLDITSLKNAVRSLERALNVVVRKEREEGGDPDEIETLRAGVSGYYRTGLRGDL